MFASLTLRRYAPQSIPLLRSGRLLGSLRSHCASLSLRSPSLSSGISFFLCLALLRYAQSGSLLSAFVATSSLRSSYHSLRSLLLVFPFLRLHSASSLSSASPPFAPPLRCSVTLRRQDFSLSKFIAAVAAPKGFESTKVNPQGVPLRIT